MLECMLKMDLSLIAAEDVNCFCHFSKQLVVSWKITHPLPILPSWNASKPLPIWPENVRISFEAAKKVEALYLQLPQISKNQDIYQ